MNRRELVAAIADQCNVKKTDVDKVMEAFAGIVEEELKHGEKVAMAGFGTFEVSERAAREGRNPRSGETMMIPACRTPKFRAGKALKEAVNA